ncbi:uncharacterized protein LOC104456191, partial [Eucalyptus grandis]|uniref:uncharacterized protein LOC104456191 n=1 Tax=Eucalyptus grandis TaxID=71139 RepID=UPI00192EF7F3
TQHLRLSPPLPLPQANRVRRHCLHQLQESIEHASKSLDDKLIGIHRRSVALGLVIGSLSLGFGEQSATAAARRPPAPPPEEKKDPNVSGVQAKVLASKKRKEAMKESIAKLREKGKPVNQSSE